MAIPTEALTALHYNPTTGQFTWLVSPSGSVQRGQVAGYVSKSNGYVYIGYKGKSIRAHRLAYYLMRKPVPAQIDHRDGDRTNNSWDNLRDATVAENGWNRSGTTNRLGIKGVRFHKGTYEANICRHGERRSARFGTLDEAVSWLHTARRELHGAFANGG